MALSAPVRRLMRIAFAGKDGPADELCDAVDAVAGITPAEIAVLDGVTPGKAAASKALVLSAGSALSFAAAALPLTVKANTAATMSVSDGTTTMFTVDSRNTIANVSNFVFTAAPPTVATAAAVHLNPTVQVAAKTVTYTGTATVTSSLGVGMHIGIPTFTDAAAGTLSLASNLHVAAVAAAGGSLTLTAARMISTGVTDAFLTNAGVWTDTACWADAKEQINHATGVVYDRIANVIDKIQVAAWRYAPEFERSGYDDKGNVVSHLFTCNDRDRDRVGVMYDDLPEELRAPGEERGVSAGLLASFALAAIKTLWDRNRDLESRLAALESR